MTAPTEQEIRQAVTSRIADWPNDNPATPLREAIEGLTTMLHDWQPEPGDSAEMIDEIRHMREAGPDPDDLWWNLRPTEAARLNAIREETIERAFSRALVVITDEIVAAGLTFGREYPDAPRAKVEVTA